MMGTHNAVIPTGRHQMSKDQIAALKFLGMHLACGVAAAAVFGTAILVSDLSHIRTLAFQSPHAIIIITLMYFGLTVTFGGVAMVVGIMGLGDFSDNNRNEKDVE